jgi:hypothetical protein
MWCGESLQSICVGIGGFAPSEHSQALLSGGRMMGPDGCLSFCQRGFKRASVCVCSLLRQTLLLDGLMKQLAKHLSEKQSLLIFGRGYNYATALEAALKVKEVAYMHR